MAKGSSLFGLMSVRNLLISLRPYLKVFQFSDKEFKLAVDASDVGIDNGVDHTVSYYSKKFNKHQGNYSTIERACLSLILALQYFEVYLVSSVAPIVIFSDHNPLNEKNKNQHLLSCKSTTSISDISREKIISPQMCSLSRDKMPPHC